MTTGPRELVRRLLSGQRQLLTVAASLVGTQVTTSVFGFVYWSLAARTFPVASVGLAAAAISAMNFLGTIGVLGLGTLLISELPRHPRQDWPFLTRTATIASGAAGAAFGLVFAMLAGRFSHGLALLGATPWSALLFALGVALTAATMVLDQAVLASGRGGLQLARNVVASAVKTVLLVGTALMALGSGMVIYATWTAGLLLSLWTIRRVLSGPRLRQWADLHLLRGLGAAAGSHHALNLALQAPTMVLPLVVAVILSPTETAYFSTAALVCGFVSVLPFALTIALFASSAQDETAAMERMPSTLAVAGVTSTIGILVLLASAPYVMRLFGADYAANGVVVLRVLALGGLPLVIKDHYVALRRVQNRTGRAARVALVGTAFELGAATIGGILYGLTGVCVAWVAMLAVEALLLTPAVAHALHGIRPVESMRRTAGFQRGPG
ncbi:MAG TPA: lipopolysaccharide biosynthesis protein [Actinomycetes bacterium]|nr:lipopolysaccharide biosynthesis protein [Actinomycetes bacterium]